MNQPPTHHTAGDPQSRAEFDRACEAYAACLLREAVRHLARRRPVGEVEDIASMLVLAFLAKAATVMAQYPDAATYARVAVRRTGIAFDRHERAQRGEGVRLRTRADGSVAPGRTVVSGDAPAGAAQLALFDLVVGPVASPQDAVVERLDVTRELDRCLQGVATADRTLLLMVDGVGYTVNEVAAAMGQRRETLSRRLGRIRRQVEANRALMDLSPAG